MDVHRYRTIENAATGQYREKGSRFLAFAYPVENEDEIRRHLEELQREYFDARHHCYAWMLGADQTRHRAHDAGEPNHSAGDPILGQIRSRNLTNVLVVVVRYFGGVKLGVGGLITAYRAAADDALSHAAMVEREVRGEIEIRYSYEATPVVMRLVRDFALTVLSQDFGAHCLLNASYGLSNREAMVSKLALLHATGSDISYELTDP